MPAKLRWLDRIRSPSFGEVLKFLEALSYVAGLAGVLLILVQLKADADDRRVTQSLSLVERYNTAPLYTHKRSLIRFWLTRRDRLALMRRAGGVAREDAAVFVSSEIAQYNKNRPEEDIYLAINQIADFYDQLSICMDSRNCDEATILRYFAQPSREFYCLYTPIIQEQRVVFGNAKLGQGLVKIAGGIKCL
jgi:hypothetical protein